jgi:RND family efflux transporter MFP subunit
VLAVIVAGAAVLAGGCKPKTNTYVPPPPATVTVAHPVQRTVTRFLEYTGTTEPYESVELRARVAGFLDKIHFHPGAEVKKGDLLFEIDPRVYEAQARQAEAELTARKANLHIAELTLGRLQEAARASAGTQQELDRAAAERDQARAQVELADAALTAARLNVEFTQVRAPIDGRITKNLVDVGNLVGSGGDPTVLATIVSLKPLYVTVDASESDVLMVRRERMVEAPGAEPGQIEPGEWRPVSLATADDEEFSVRGHIDYVDPALDPMTGTIKVRARFENENLTLLPGLFVRVRVFLKSQDALVAPDIALLSDQNGRYALVVNEKNMVEVRRVKIGTLDGTLRVVTDGLTAQDRIVINGLQGARPGATVNPTDGTIGPPGAPPPPGVTVPAKPSGVDAKPAESAPKAEGADKKGGTAGAEVKNAGGSR